MHVECPNCRHPIPRIRLFFTPAWGRFTCDGCGSVLGVNVRRRLLATFPWLAILILLVEVLKITSLGYAIWVPLLFAAGVTNYFFFDRPVVHQRTGFRCRRCGYDLQGQEEGRCPECGLQFELDELALHKAGRSATAPTPSWARTRTAIAVILGLLVLVACGVLMYLKTAWGIAARQRAASTQPAATQQSTIDKPAATAPAVGGDEAPGSETP